MTVWICAWSPPGTDETSRCGSRYTTLGSEPLDLQCPDCGHFGWWRLDVPKQTPSADVLTPAAASSESASAALAPPGVRRRMPSERRSVTRKFRVRYRHRDGTDDSMKIYVTAGLFEDGQPGELFIRADRMGTMARGALDATATMVSLLLQYGVPLDVVTSKLRHTRYEPAGFTGDREFPSCTSVLDLVAQWLERRFQRREGE